MEFYKQDAMSSVIPSFSTSRISESRSFSSSLHGANALLHRGTAAAAAAAPDDDNDDDDDDDDDNVDGGDDGSE